MKFDKEIVLADGWRTPIGHVNSCLSHYSAEALMAKTIEEVMKRSKLDPALLDGVIVGWVGQGSNAPNIARVATLMANLPNQCVAFTEQVNCVSGMDTIASAARRIAFDEGEIFLAGGTESMSQMPYSIRGDRSVKGIRTIEDLKKNWEVLLEQPGIELTDCMLEGLVDPVRKLSMAATAELLAQIHHISREEQDQYAIKSYASAIDAVRSGFYKSHVFEVPGREGEMVDHDENPELRERYVKDPSKLSKMITLFDNQKMDFEDFYKQNASYLNGAKFIPGKTKGTITPFNACPRSDGAAGVLVTTRERAEKENLHVIGRLRGWGFGGIDPGLMGKAPAYATDIALKRNGLEFNQIDVIELHEAFAAGCLAIFDEGKKELGHDWQEKWDEGRINRHGGSLALGHPLAASGTRIVLNLCHALREDPSAGIGMASACAAGGIGCSMIVEKAS